jgi:hypothetical protein
MSNTNKVFRSSYSNASLLQTSSPPITAFKSGALLSTSGQFIHLRHYHTFGRATECHTHLIGASMSRIHAIVYWQDNNWYIEDKSKNGVWLNNNKIIKGQPHLLRESDKVALSSKVGDSFIMVNDLKPCDVLISMALNKPAIYLERPTTSIEKTLNLFYENEGWYLIYDDERKESKVIQDGNCIHINDSLYRLQSNQVEYQTLENKPTARSLDDLELKLNVSANEEDIQLYIKDNKSSSIIKGHRIQSQLYLLLCLARKSIADKEQGYSECHCGWINLDTLSKALGIEPDNTRIRLHRLRTKIRDTVNFSGVDACQLLQLQDGEVRLNTSKIVVIKGNLLKTELGVV